MNATALRTVLYVDDEPDIREIVRIALGLTRGLAVHTASSGEQALTLVREQQPDLILMDIQLPGMDGLKATALLKQDELTRAIPVIALTALAMSGDEERIRAAGCDGYIAKPFAYREFLATIAAQLSQAVHVTAHES